MYPNQWIVEMSKKLVLISSPLSSRYSWENWPICMLIHRERKNDFSLFFSTNNNFNGCLSNEIFLHINIFLYILQLIICLSYRHSVNSLGWRSQWWCYCSRWIFNWIISAWQLPHARSEWREFERQFQVGRHYHAAMLMSDYFANCSVSSKWEQA